MKIQIEKMASLVLLVSMGTVLGFLKSMIPLPLPPPGIRLGLSNLVVLTSLSAFGDKEGFIVTFLKSLLLMLATGDVMAFFYSATGSILPCLAMTGAIRWIMPRISSIGVNLTGASLHNLGQASMTCLIVSNWRIFAYLLILLLLGIFIGFFVEPGSNFIVDQMKRNNIVLKEQK